MLSPGVRRLLPARTSDSNQMGAATAEIDTVAAATDKVEQQLGILIRRARENLKRAASSVHPELSPFGYQLLAQVHKLGSVGAGALAGALDVDRSVLSRALRQLEKWELVEVTC